MNKEKEDIKAIREMMEKSSKFLSFSGLSGIIAGVFALLGTAFAYFFLLKDPSIADFTKEQEMLILFCDALVVLILSIAVVIFFSNRKAKKNGQKLFSGPTKRTIYSLAIPLVAGGIFCLIFLLRGDISMVAAGTLIFYGLALINASKYTYEEIHHLGLTEVVIGLLALIFSANYIIFWAIGFGLCHIIYGWLIYAKYDKVKK